MLPKHFVSLFFDLNLSIIENDLRCNFPELYLVCADALFQSTIFQSCRNISWVDPELLFLFDLILYIPSTIIQLCREGSSWVEPVLS